MRLRRLDLTRYGKFTDQAIDFGPRQEGRPDLHIVYGLNEAGKSTALSGFLDLLFGIEERTRYAFLHTRDAMEIGGALEFGGALHELKRMKGRANTLRDGRGQILNETLLSVPLAGLSRETYRLMFSLDDQTLEDGGNAILDSKGDLGELLFSASAGLADLSRILETIAAEADAIFRKQASKTQIATLKRQLGELKTQRDGIDLQASAHTALMAARTQAGQAYDAAVQERAATKQRRAALDRLLRAHPLAGDYREAAAQRAALAHLPHPPRHWADELPHLMNDDTRLQTQATGLETRIAGLKAEIAALPEDRAVLACGDRLGRLGDAAARYRNAQDDLPKRRAALAALTERIGALLRAVGRAATGDPEALLVPAPVVGTLRDLIEQRSGVMADVAAARAELDIATRAVADAREDRARRDAGATPDDAARLAAVREILARLKQSDLSARLRLAERDLPQKQRAYEAALGDLAPWTGDGPALRALALPDAEQIDHWRKAAAALDLRRAGHVERLRELETQRREPEARVARLMAAAGAIDDASAASLRAARDAAWTAHLAALDRDSAQAFEARMHAADALADARLAKANDLAELRTLSDGLARLQVQLVRQGELLAEVDGERAHVRAALLRAIPAPLTLDPDTPLPQALTRLDRWSRARDAALAADTNVRAAEEAFAAAQAEAAGERARLCAALGLSGTAADDQPLAVLLHLAEETMAAAAKHALEREAADQALRVQDRDLATRQRTAAAADAALAAWQDRWSAALAGTWFAAQGADPAAVRAILDTLGDLPAALDARADLRHRIDTMVRDQQAFVTELTDLFSGLGGALDPDAVLASARTLEDRLEVAQRTAQRRQEKADALASLVQEQAALAGTVAVHAARKAELLAFFGVADLLAVSQSLAQCAVRDRLEAECRRLETQIVTELQAPSLEAALAHLAGLDLDALTREHTELADRLEDLDERVKGAFAEHARAADRLNAIGGDDAVARLDAQRRTVLLQIEDQALHFLRLKTGGLVAAQALRAYRDSHRSSMMERASEAFRLITRGAYLGLATRPDKERETLIGRTAAGGSKLAADMSKGTRFQLYLALRLAGYEEFAAARPAVPFIADDIMETFDEPRSQEVFRLFGQMAQVGQVIYLTHHRHLCDIARQVMPDVRIHELAS